MPVDNEFEKKAIAFLLQRCAKKVEEAKGLPDWVGAVNFLGEALKDAVPVIRKELGPYFQGTVAPMIRNWLLKVIADVEKPSEVKK